MTLLYADLHIHSRYSRATSSNMEPKSIAHYARVKGLDIVGTGDFTHPQWLLLLQELLVEDPAHPGLFHLSEGFGEEGVWFLLQAEVCTVFPYHGVSRKVHHVILSPSFEVTDQVNDVLERYGPLDVDGRPSLSLSAPELVDVLSSASKDVEVFPAHAWTPWYGIFGSRVGFNSLKECYQDAVHRIHALETGLSCYDEKTDVLTDNGWKKFFEVKYTDKICTLNIKSDKIEFQCPEKIFSYDYEGKMYRLKTKRVDLLVTPNHNLFVTTCDFRNPKPFFLKEAKLLFGKPKQFKKDGKWIGRNEDYFILPAVDIKHGSRHYSGFRKKEEKKIPMKDWLKFFGFWLAEGWTDQGKNGNYNIYVCNANEELIFEMKHILESFGYNVFYNAKIHRIRVRDYQLFTYLKQFGKCYEKFIPSDIKTLSKDFLQILLEYYIKGDGHVYGRKGKGLSATTTSIRLRDDLQEIALKVGMSAYYKLHNKKGSPFKSSSQGKLYRQKNNSWVVYFIRKNKHAIIPSYIKKYDNIEDWVDFEGKVYCISVPNKVIYVRRNGIPVWCGNSDPPMNWRLSSLDGVTLISSSDSHSPYPSRIGREATVFNLEKPSYSSLLEAIRKKDPRRVLYTIETHPEYGKYHWTGHRRCNISMSPSEAIKIGNICPVCRRPLTIGVEQRVEELADRPSSSTPPGDFPGFKYLLPLEEVLERVLKRGYQVIQGVYRSLIDAGGSEYKAMLDLPLERIAEIGGGEIASAIKALREGTVKVKPGYDGVYGEIDFPTLHEPSTPQVSPKKSVSLDEFM
jgi:PHP family Zn ribbon phosphoesterase